MMEFKNSLKIPFINFKFLLIILILSLITILGSTASLISIILTVFLSIGLVGTNILSSLKNYNSKTILKIFELSVVYFIASFLYLIFQGIISIILLIPVFLLKSSIDVENVFSFNSGLLIIILLFIITIFCYLVLEFVKNIGYISYIKSGRFEDFFNFKKHFKIVFTKNMLVSFFYLLGYLIILLIGYILVLSILTLLFPSISYYLIGIFTIIFIYIYIFVTFIIFNEIYKAYK